jgi:hypothetical protein
VEHVWARVLGQEFLQLRRLIDTGYRDGFYLRGGYLDWCLNNRRRLRRCDNADREQSKRNRAAARHAS